MRSLAIAMIISLVSGVANAEDAKEVHKKAQGRWERMVNETPAPDDRMVKEIEGNKETLSVYQGDELIYQHQVDFKIDVLERVTVFTFKNLKVTEGAEAGRTMDGEFSYLFQIRDDNWVEVQGLLNEDAAQPKLTIYKRAKAKSDDQR